MRVSAYKFRVELVYVRPSRAARFGLGSSRFSHLLYVHIYCASVISQGGQVSNTECTKTEANDSSLILYSVLEYVT